MILIESSIIEEKWRRNILNISKKYDPRIFFSIFHYDINESKLWTKKFYFEEFILTRNDIIKFEKLFNLN